MCRSCNHQEWADAGRSPLAFQQGLPADRLQACTDAYERIRAAAHDFDWQGGSLHVQVDNDNYDVPWGGIDLWWPHPAPYPEPPMVVELDAGQAWNGLRFYERMLVVAWLNGYWADVRPPVAA